MASDGLAVHWDVTMNLLMDGRIRPRPVRVWSLTKRGTSLLGSIEVPSSLVTIDRLTHVKALPTTQNFSHDVTAVEHLLHYRAWGAEIVTVREMIASEKDLNAPNQKTIERKPKHWISTRPNAVLHAEPTHTPDGGALLDGSSWQIEVELACKNTRTYRADIEAMLTGPHRIIWHTEQTAAREHLIEAARTLLPGEPGPDATWRSNDYRLWIVPSLGRGPVDGESAGFDAVAYLAGLVHPTTGKLAPAGRERADLRAAWERRPDVAALAGKLRAVRAERAAAEEVLVQRALAQRLAPGTYDIAGVPRTWDGAVWSAPDVGSLWDAA